MQAIESALTMCLCIYESVLFGLTLTNLLRMYYSILTQVWQASSSHYMRQNPTDPAEEIDL